MSKKGLPSSVKMRHDSHYVEEFAKNPSRSVGKIIAINQIEPNPDQPRVEIGDLTELSDSIKQKGVLEPILVKPNGDGTWMIIAGERRWRAANLAGLREVPCIELDIDEKSIAEIALIENLQRKDLNVWEEADGLAFLGSRYGYTHEGIAKKIGKSRSTVTESFAISGLPESIREKCRQAGINAKSMLLEIARQFDEKAMHSFLEDIGNVESNRKKILVRKETKSKITSKSKKIMSAPANESKNAFEYIAVNQDFRLEISFIKSDPFQKRDVLKALKETFDKTKAKD